MIKAIIFDLWDTLFYTDRSPHPFNIFAQTIGQTFSDYDFMKKFEKHIMLDESKGLKQSIVSLLADLNIPLANGLVDDLTTLLIQAYDEATYFPETMDALKNLKPNYKLGLITNTSRQSYQFLQDKYKIIELFDVIVTSFESKIIKPDPKIFKLALNRLGVEPSEALMVGDSLKDDIEASEKLGLRALLIDRKNKHPDAKRRIVSLTEIAGLV